MSRRARGQEDLIRKHIWVDVHIWQKIEDYYGDNVGTSQAVRAMLASFMKAVEARASEKHRPLPPAKLEDIPIDTNALSRGPDGQS